MPHTATEDTHVRHQTPRGLQAVEVVSVFAVGVAIVLIGAPLAGQNPLARQAVVWVANVAMLAIVWLGLRLRGQAWAHLGLGVSSVTWGRTGLAVLKSAVVSVAAIAAFVLGSIVAGAFVGAPEQADMSGYDYLRGNLPMLLLALAAVYVVSSFGEEVIYRGFLITRLEEFGQRGRASTWSAVIGSSVIFGLIHFEWGFMGVVQTGFMGLALGASYLLVGRNLWILVLAHMYLDTLLLVQLYLPAS